MLKVYLDADPLLIGKCEPSMQTSPQSENVFVGQEMQEWFSNARANFD